MDRPDNSGQNFDFSGLSYPYFPGDYLSGSGSVFPSIVMPPGVQGAQQYMEGPPVPPGVFPPAPTAPPAAPQQYTVPGSAPRDLGPVPDTGQGTWWNNAVGAAGDIGTAAAGLAERFNKGAANMLGLRSPGSDIYRAELPVAPGLERAGDVATFLTGGLSNSLFPAAGALRAAAGYAPTAARSAARTMGELARDEAGTVPLSGRLVRGTPSTEEAAAAAAPARAAEEPGFGPIYHRTTADIENLNQVDLSKASPSARLGPAVYGSLEGGPEWNPAGMGGKVLSGRVKGDIIDLTKPLPAADQARLEDVVGRAIPEGAHELALEKKFGSVAAGLKEAGYTGALHEGPGGTGTHVAVFDPANIIPGKTPVPEGVQAPGVAAQAPTPPGALPLEGAPAAAAEAPVPIGVRGYHGSPHDFAQFDPATAKSGFYGPGTYFHKAEIDAVKHKFTADAPEGGKMYETSLGIKQPFDMSAPVSAKDTAAIYEALGQPELAAQTRESGKGWRNGQELWYWGLKQHAVDARTDALRKAGFDAIIANPNREMTGATKYSDIINVLDPSIIKILRKYGLAGAIVGGGAATLGGAAQARPLPGETGR